MTQFIENIRLDGILSYGRSESAFPLKPLNVLIGPNTSGKSNLIEALSLLTAAPRDLQAAIREGGGVRDWIWKGDRDNVDANLDVTVAYGDEPPLRYTLSFAEVGARFEVTKEVVEKAQPLEGMPKPYVFYYSSDGRPVFIVQTEDGEVSPKRRPVSHGIREQFKEQFKPNQSILSQVRSYDVYPELTYLADKFERMAFYREWGLGRRAAARLPQSVDMLQDSLLEDASNLAVVLSVLLNDIAAREWILGRMREFYPSIRNIQTPVQGPAVQVSFHEEGLRHPVPATRLSDGSMRYLCLLASLCNPNPPPLICIEEPEVGLHPDIIPEVAQLLKDASARSQIIATTHSDALVDALTDTPESVVVCEKVNGSTQLRRLDAEELAVWLKDYRLGELWTRGDLGGNRW